MLSLAGLVAAFALGVPLFMYFAQDRLIFYPQPATEARQAEVRREFPQVKSVYLEGGPRQHAWHLKGSDSLVLYFGGNAEDVSWMVNEAVARAPAMSWLLVDYRGYGASEGSPSEAHLVADALRWYDHAVAALGAKRVFVFGRSLGSGVAVQVAASRRVAGVVLVAPYDSLTALAGHYYPWLPVSLLLKHKFDSIERAPRIGAPLLCLVASHDEVIPAAHSKRLYEAWGGPKRWVDLDRSGHNDTDAAPSFWASIQRFLAAPDKP